MKLNLTRSVILITAYLCNVAWAMNAWVAPEDIHKMKKAKIGDNVIQMFIAEQTSTVTADFLINLKNKGADEKTLAAVILADRYKCPKNTDLSLEQWEILKKAGYSEETLQKLFNGPSVKKVVDEHGNERIVYTTGGPSPAQTKTPDYSRGTYNIHIERIEPR